MNNDILFFFKSLKFSNQIYVGNTYQKDTQFLHE